MRCRNCDYPLWNLKTRQCPECGSPFAPSDYVFIPNSVRFCCPHCDQSYYGVGQNGHIEPARFECVKCHQHISLNEMVLRPAEGIDESGTQRDRMPWFERQRLGTFKAWWQTIGHAMGKPSQMIPAVPRDQSAGSAWVFMFVTNLIFQIVGNGIPMAVALIIVWIIGQQVQGMGGLMTQMMWQSWWQLPLSLVLLAFVPVLWMWLSHLLLSAVGAATEPMRRTAHCIYYSSPAAALSALPCGDCTQLAGKVWWIVSAILMTKTAHRCSGGKATFAVLTAAIVSWGATIGVSIIVAFIYMGNTFAGGGMAAIGVNMSGSMMAPIVVSNLNSYASEHDGRTPPHAAELIVDQGMGASNFSVVTSQMSIPIGDSNLAALSMLAPIEQREIIDEVVNAQPEDVIAHRFGDMIFTYHGMNLPSSDNSLWVLIVWPQSMNTSPGPGSRITVCFADRSIMQFPPSNFSAELETQNRRRRMVGLAPLPADLLSIGHDEPVTESAAAADSDRD